MSEQRPMLYLIDGHGVIFTAHFAFIRNPLRNSKGMNTSAVFGFTSMLMKLLRDHKPAWLAVAMDVKGKTFRHKMYEAYKANRPPTPPELIAQEPFIYDVLKGYAIPTLSKEGYEADDVLAEVARKAVSKGFDVRIVSKDKDVLQLVNERVTILAPSKGLSDLNLLGSQEVKQKIGVRPDQVVDYLSLLGDTSDNVPGVPGVGKKTAAKLLATYDTLEGIYENITEIRGKKLQENLLLHKDRAFLSRELVRLDHELGLSLSFEDLKLKEMNSELLQKVFRELEFREFQRSVTGTIKPEDVNYHCVETEAQFNEMLAYLKDKSLICVDVETDGLNPFDTKLVGVSLCAENRKAFYVPCGHTMETHRQLTEARVIQGLKPILENPAIGKVGHNIKFDWEVLHSHGLDLKGVCDDTMVAGWLIKPERRQNNLDDLSLEYLNERKTPTSSLIGKGAKAITMDRVPIDTVSHYACEDVDTAFRLRQIFREETKRLDLLELYETIEMPLIPVLMKIERNGIKVDVPFLEQLSERFTADLKKLEEEIFAEAGEVFNINSPKQLSEILFEKLGYPTKGIRKTSLGHSTAEASLRKLVLQGGLYRQLPDMILEYRSITKLLNTYVKSLLDIRDPQTDRIHTSFNQTVAETGRLSSSDPNLQNIPIRTEQGRKIRKAFIAQDDDWVLLSADYSQIELRILAHVAQDPVMLDAFEQGVDVHAHTASEIFSVPLETVTDEQRRMAKTINFGIDYGMTEWGLSSRLNIPVNYAREYIERYLSRYHGVREYIQKTIEYAREKGYVKTLFNRRRYLPEINSEKRQIRESAERKAINMPIQGTAAEMIKLAMIAIQKELEEQKFSTRMILQVHDELVFEVPKAELDSAVKLIRDKMEHALTLAVPVVVDMNWGKNWAEAH